MSIGEKRKDRPKVILTSVGSAAGTSAFIDTDAYNTVQVNTWGNSGSTTVCVYVNAGTTVWLGTDIPAAIFVGSGRSDSAGGGSPVITVGSLLDQALITHGTSGTGTLNSSYILYDA